MGNARWKLACPKEALGAGVEGIVELDAAVLIVALVDELEQAVDSGPEHVDLVEGFEGRGTLELFSLLLGVVLGVEAVLEGIFVAYGSSHELPSSEPSLRLMKLCVMVDYTEH
jgi:hypothetical protein